MQNKAAALLTLLWIAVESRDEVGSSPQSCRQALLIHPYIVGSGSWVFGTHEEEADHGTRSSDEETQAIQSQDIL